MCRWVSRTGQWSAVAASVLALACGDNQAAPPDATSPDGAGVPDLVLPDLTHAVATHGEQAWAGVGCGISNAGALYCWGYLPNLVTRDPAPATQVTSQTDWIVVALGGWFGDFDGGRFMCALRANGDRWCAGDNRLGELGTAMPIGTNTPITMPTYIDGGWARLSVGGTNVCGIKRDGTLLCWGAMGEPNNPDVEIVYTPTAPYPNERWLDVAASARFTCAVHADRALVCWGTQTYDDTARDWASVSVDHDGANTCAIKLDGTLWCFGNNTVGQLDPATAPGPVAAPIQIGTDSDWAVVRPGGDHICGLKAGGALSCWGLNTSGQFGVAPNMTNILATTPIVVPGNTWSALTTGFRHTCGRASTGEMMCWGERRVGLQDPPTQLHVPLRVGSASDWVDVAPTEVARKADGSVHKWNLTGWLVLTATSKFPVHAADPMQISSTAIAGTLADSNDACFVGLDDAAYCHDGPPAAGSLPTVAPFSSARQPGTWKHIDGGSRLRCGIDLADALKCWGHGVLGNGTIGESSTPVEVSGGGAWLRVATTGRSSCGIHTDGSLWCWGDNTSGEVGVGTTTAQYLAPVRVGTASDWTSIGLAGARVCGLRGAGSLWCWGGAGYSGVGDGTTMLRRAPTQIGTATWSMVSVAPRHVCGVQSDQSLWCWGDNYKGYVGVAEPVYVKTPTKIGDGWIDVAGTEHWGGSTCGIKTDGSLWCWGVRMPRLDVPLQALP
jgi:alpha-tubulin suppressor-like RCC1 family protein